MLQDIFLPWPSDDPLRQRSYNDRALASSITLFDGSDLDLSNFDIAIVYGGGFKHHTEVRGALNEMYSEHTNLRILDLGTLGTSSDVSKTAFAIDFLMKHDLCIIYVGQDHEETTGQYIAHKGLNTRSNAIIIDRKIDLEDDPEDNGYLMKMMIDEELPVSGLHIMGFQTHYTHPKAINTIESLDFDLSRLGKLRSEIKECEPFFRDANLVSVDLSAIRGSDAPTSDNPTPNGLFGEEICQLMYFAGHSDQVRSLGIYGFDENKIDHCTAELTAQSMWYFIDGYYNRLNDRPDGTDDYVKYTVDLQETDGSVIFWKSKKTDRWWMEIPLSSTETKLVACTYTEYESACADELPDRWMRAYAKLV